MIYVIESALQLFQEWRKTKLDFCLISNFFRVAYCYQLIQPLCKKWKGSSRIKIHENPSETPDQMNAAAIKLWYLNQHFAHLTIKFQQFTFWHRSSEVLINMQYLSNLWHHLVLVITSPNAEYKAILHDCIFTRCVRVSYITHKSTKIPHLLKTNLHMHL